MEHLIVLFGYWCSTCNIIRYYDEWKDKQYCPIHGYEMHEICSIASMTPLVGVLRDGITVLSNKNQIDDPMKEQ